jgi:predicted NBD/HSP70 family sugar kinase
VSRAGLAFEGPVDATGRVEKSVLAMGWEGFDLVQAVREHLGVAVVVADNRTACQALGEEGFGALRAPEGQTCQSWLYARLDQHVEGAAGVAGRLWRGHSRAAIDLGSVCIERDGALCDSGRRGCLDAYCGETSFLTRARANGLTYQSTTEVWEARGANFAARSLCDDYVKRLAQGLGAALAIYNPGRLLLGGTVALQLGERLLEPLRTHIGDFCRTEHAALNIVAGQLGRDAAVMGAVALARDDQPVVGSSKL